MNFTFEHYDEVNSTNDLIRERGIQGAEEGLVISANRQLAGKGRRGRVWKSEIEGSVITSMLLRPELPAENIPAITIVASIAVARVCEEMTREKVYIKWPNDIIISDRKVCGILCENHITGGHVDFVVVGIGVNVHQKEFPEQLENKAISLDMVKRHDGHISRKTIMENIWQEFDSLYAVYLKTGDLRYMKSEYEEHFISMNQPVYITEGNAAVEVIALGIDFDGSLLVDNDGEVRRINSGEVSVRGIYGYV